MKAHKIVSINIDWIKKIKKFEGLKNIICYNLGAHFFIR